MTADNGQIPLNPWCTIPPEDYEAHMSNPLVGQQQFLSRTLLTVLESLKPARVAIPGCATGNGLEHIDPTVTTTTVGIDINPVFLGILYQRFRHRLPGLQLFCTDVSELTMPARSVDCIHCALMLEYTEPESVLERFANWLTPGGMCSLVLQLHSPHAAAVSPTGITSLLALNQILHLLDPEEIKKPMRHLGFVAVTESVHTLPSGKSFYHGKFRLVS